jgi:N-acyl-D-amino-acid deacylase
LVLGWYHATKVDYLGREGGAMFDLLVRGGTVIDGSGLAGYSADVAVRDGKIAAIGRFKGMVAKEVIDADGLVVTPGFIDGHTHMDAQIFWDPIGSCSCYHGITTVVMGNCGFTLAPCREKQADLVFRNLERAEDISRDAMLASIKWRWETYPEYLDVIDSLPKGINYAGYIGHSALRTYVMGERAFDGAASDDDVAAMTREVKSALRAGAIGFSTSQGRFHETSDNRPVASRLAEWREMEAIAGSMSELNAGIFEIAADLHGGPDYDVRLRELALSSGRPVTYGMVSGLKDPTDWRPHMERMETASRQGGRMFAQVHTRDVAILLSFETALPFDNWDGWRELRRQPLEQQRASLRDPATRSRLVEIASRPYQGPTVYGPAGRPPDWELIFMLDSMSRPKPSLAQLARERKVSPVEVMIDEALKRDLKLFFRQVVFNADEQQVLELMRHPRSVVTFSDAGAHVTQIMDNSMQTHLLSYWVREREAFTLEQAVRKVTYETASHYGFADRGLVREGFAADLVVLNPQTLASKMPEVRRDLPTGKPRLFQAAEGIAATVVNGEILLRNGQPTGNLPGRLLRARVPGH